MRKRTKNIFFLVLSILFLYLALAYFGPLRTTTYYGWIEGNPESSHGGL